MRSQRGFGTIGFLILLPFLISILAVIGGTALVFKADSHMKHECRSSLLVSQRSVAEKLRRLLELNPAAARARETLASAKEAKRSALMTGQPELIASAEAALVLAHAASLALSIQQQSLILSARAISIQAPIKARAVVLASLIEEANASGVAAPHTSSRSYFGRFKLNANPSGDLTPDYQPVSRFTIDQTADIEIKMPLAPLLPGWLRELVPTQNLEMKTHCQATIVNEEDKWIETLNAVR